MVACLLALLNGAGIYRSRCIKMLVEGDWTKNERAKERTKKDRKRRERGLAKLAEKCFC